MVGPRFRVVNNDLRVRSDVVVPLVLALARASDVSSKDLAEAFLDDKGDVKFSKLFLSELIRMEAEKEDEEEK